VTIIRRTVRILVRPALALVAIGAVGTVATACSTVRPPALTVNGDDISRDSVDRQLSAIADNRDLKGQISETNGTIKSSGSSIWLTHVVTQQVVDRQVQRHHLRVASADRIGAQAQAESFFGTQAFAAFPKWFRDQTLDGFARQQALFRAIGAPATDADVLRAYNTTIAQLKAQCPSGRFVSHILVATQQQAAALAAQLAAGANFEQLARQQSIDTGSASDGGELGCIDGPQLVEPFRSTAASLPLNRVSAPLQTQFGWHLILVRDTIPFALLEPALRERVGQQSPDAQRRVNRLVARSTVDVDPRYGRWVVRNGRGSVVPPPGAPRSAPAATAPASPVPTGP
jgi:parvulin-like peptidyl-prolyl isomerase